MDLIIRPFGLLYSSKHPPKTMTRPLNFLIIGAFLLLPQIIKSQSVNQYATESSIKRRYDLTGGSSSYDLADSFSDSPRSSSSSATYGLPNTQSFPSTSYSPSSSHSSLLSDYQNPMIPNYSAANGYSSGMMNFPGSRGYGLSNQYSMYPYRLGLSSLGGYSPSLYGSHLPSISRFGGYRYPFYGGLRRNGYKSRKHGKSHYSKRYRKPYYRSAYPRYRSKSYYDEPYKFDKDYDETVPASSSPSETVYKFSTGNGAGSKDYLKIGGIGNNLITYLASSLLKGELPKTPTNSTGFLETAKESLSSLSASSSSDGPFIQFGETKITLKTNEKGGLTVTVGKSKMK